LPEADFEFVVLADTHYMLEPGEAAVEFSSRRLQSERADRAWQVAASLGCPDVFHMGDLVQEFPGTEGFLAARTAAIEQFRGHGLEPRFVAGNHDIGDKPDPTMPTRPVTPESLAEFHQALGPSWYALDLGPLHVVVLNSQIINSSLPEEVAQRDWAETDLEEHSDSRLVVMLHLPPYLERPTEPGLGHYDNIADPGRVWLLELLERHEVELLLAAHVHCSVFDQIGSTRYRILNSTSFTRPGFCHMFTSAVPPDQGRDDAAKLGLLLARVRDERIDLHWLRTEEPPGSEHLAGTGLGDPPAEGWQTVLTGTPSTLPDSNVGLELAYPLAVRTEIPRAWPSVIRQSVRNDYPLLACLELGIRAIRVPANDLDDPFLASRIAVLRNEQVDVIASVLWDETLDVPGLIERHGGRVDAWEWQLAGTMYPSESQWEMLARLQVAGVPQALSRVIPGEIVPGKQHPRTATGFSIDALAELDSQLARAGVVLDRVVCRLEPGPELAGGLAEMIRAERLESIRGVDWRLQLEGIDDRSSLEWAVMSLVGTAAVPGSRLFIGPLMDMDRTMDVRHGLLDSLCNPRPVFDALRCLNSILSAADRKGVADSRRVDWTVFDSAVVGESEAIALVIPRVPLSGQALCGLVDEWSRRAGRFRAYDLVGCRVAEKGPDELSACLGTEWSGPLLMVAGAWLN
jgi:hypothetical protein